MRRMGMKRTSFWISTADKESTVMSKDVVQLGKDGRLYGTIFGSDSFMTCSRLLQSDQA